jgi:hypothetical protein
MLQPKPPFTLVHVAIHGPARALPVSLIVLEGAPVHVTVGELKAALPVHF